MEEPATEKVQTWLPASKPETADFQLTWGLELEFLIIYALPYNFQALVIEAANFEHTRLELAELRIKRKLGDRACTKIVSALRSAGVPVANYNPADVQSQEISKWVVEKDGTVTMSPEALTGPTIPFANGKYVTVPLSHRQKMCSTDVELKSRVLPATSESLAEVEQVLQIIRSLPVTINETCGLHVHIGNRNLGFGLRTIKNLMYLLIMAKRQIHEIHPPERICSPVCIPMEMAFEPTDRISSRNMYESINELETVCEIVEFFTDGRNRDDVCFRYWALNLANLVHRPDRKTIEWRQHRSSIDFGEVERWLLLTSYFVKMANDVSNPFQGLETFFSVPEYNILDMISDLGAEALSKAFRGHTWNHDRSTVSYDPWNTWDFEVVEYPSFDARSKPEKPEVSDNSGANEAQDEVNREDRQGGT